MKTSNILVIILIILLTGRLVQIYSMDKTETQLKVYKAKCDSLTVYSDSLYSELYPCQVEFSRYIDALHIFMKRNPKAADQYATIISEETE